MSKRSIALLAVFSTAIFYGATYTIAKDVMPIHIKPFGFVWVRVFVTTILFWITSWVMKVPKMEKKDFPYVLLLSVFGVVLNILCFYKGLSLTTPINASVIMVTTPIIVLLFSVLFLKDKLHQKQIIGVVIGLIGAVILSLSGAKSSVNATNIPVGNLLVFVNAIFYALYMIMVKKLANKYQPLVFVRWMYLFGLIIMTPLVFDEVIEVNWGEISSKAWFGIVYVIIFATYLNFLFNLFGLKHLKPTTVSAFLYLQPVFASFFALLLGSDELNITKIASALLIFLGVYLSSQKPKITKKHA